MTRITDFVYQPKGNRGHNESGLDWLIDIRGEGRRFSYSAETRREYENIIELLKWFGLMSGSFCPHCGWELDNMEVIKP